MKSLVADRDLIENEKKYLEERIKKQDERVLDLEYQVKQKK
jgi:flagellar capping protein FliD